MDRTLKPHGGLLRARSVLTRAERIAKLMEEGKFDPEEDSPLGLPKVRVRQSRVGMKTKKVADEVPLEGAELEGVGAGEAAPEAKATTEGKVADKGKAADKGKGAAKGKGADKGRGAARGRN